MLFFIICNQFIWGFSELVLNGSSDFIYKNPLATLLMRPLAQTRWTQRVGRPIRDWTGREVRAKIVRLFFHFVGD